MFDLMFGEIIINKESKGKELDFAALLTTHKVLVFSFQSCD